MLLEATTITTAPSCAEVVGAALDIGEHMIKCGAEINRVEDTISRICRAYGYDNADVFSITSLIVVTVKPETGDAFTQARRVYNYTTSLGRLEKLNALSREICETKPPLEKVYEKIKETYSDKKRLRVSSGIGYILACGGFALFFGGTWLDALACVPISLMMFFSDSLVKRKGANRVIYTFLTSVAASALALFFVAIGFGQNADKIMIGNIMALIPGLVLTNSLREMLCGDTMCGFIRLLEALLISVSIALGFAVPMLLKGVFIA